MTIEPASHEETISLCQLFNQSRASAAGLHTQEVVTHDQFLSQVAGESLLVARVQGEIAGFVAIWVAENFIHHLFVAPAHQGRGIGAALLAHCETLYGLPLSLKCLETNRRACRFYERNGWVVKGSGNSADGPYRLYRLDYRSGRYLQRNER